MANYSLKTPISDAQIQKLHVGDNITISGTIFTARDEAHHRALQYARENRPLPFKTQNGVLYHCGPVARRTDSSWEILSAGPTTSARLEKFEAEFIKNSGIKVIIGKGGMGKQTEIALKQYKAVFCTFTGGAGVLAASFIQAVEKVEWIDLGIPEAIWVLSVQNFGPLFVAIDSYGNNVFTKIDAEVQKNKETLIHQLK
ncbi:MAG: FumA C-terminus/TtdB family hydratase beta subunit [Candidatus Helarchaeota archaeon]|nr:FumA C-terminus/TtdB family hydratase beta subunit [Candidatus Helarchaeota archaeon]